jgi:hypothetical protein
MVLNPSILASFLGLGTNGQGRRGIRTTSKWPPLGRRRHRHHRYSRPHCTNRFNGPRRLLLRHSNILNPSPTLCQIPRIPQTRPLPRGRKRFPALPSLATLAPIPNPGIPRLYRRKGRARAAVFDGGLGHWPYSVCICDVVCPVCSLCWRGDVCRWAVWVAVGTYLLGPVCPSWG